MLISNFGNDADTTVARVFVSSEAHRASSSVAMGNNFTETLIKSVSPLSSRMCLVSSAMSAINTASAASNTLTQNKRVNTCAQEMH